MEQMHDLILQPIIRFGFVGLSAVLLMIVVWMVSRLLSALERNSEVIAHNTEVMRSLTTTTSDLLVQNRDLHDKLISRPCIARDE